MTFFSQKHPAFFTRSKKNDFIRTDQNLSKATETALFQLHLHSQTISQSHHSHFRFLFSWDILKFSNSRFCSTTPVSYMNLHKLNTLPNHPLSPPLLLSSLLSTSLPPFTLSLSLLF
jgi:hypothetical protein